MIILINFIFGYFFVKKKNMNIRYSLKYIHSFLFYTLNYLYFYFGSKNIQIERLHLISTSIKNAI